MTILEKYGQNESFRVATVLKIKEFKEKLGKRNKGRKKSGNLISCLNIKVLPLLRINLIISVSVKVLRQEVIENSLRSGRTQGKVREKQNRKNGHPCIFRSQKRVNWGKILPNNL